MQISLGFVIVLILILFPGLLFRRLYFYGDFSKQFNSGYNLFSLIAVSSIPGIINLTFVFIFYDTFFAPVDLGSVIDTFKDIINPQFRSTENGGTPIKELLKHGSTPFIAFLYFSCIIFGLIFGRFIRNTGLDKKFKLLRFKNYWFYLFNGEHTSFKKMKHLKLNNKKHLFTKADILIDSNDKSHLYSGIVIDYELKWDDSRALSKVILQNAERYSIKDGKRGPVKIPGNLLVVDCATMKNINLTFIYKETTGILRSKFPYFTNVIIELLIIILIPFFIFQSEMITFEIYKDYFELSWYKQFIVYLLAIQIINGFNPFIEKKNEYRYIGSYSLIAKSLLITGTILLFYIIY